MKITKNIFAVIGLIAVAVYLYWFTEIALVEAYNRGLRQGRERGESHAETTERCFAWWFNKTLNKLPIDRRKR